MGRRIALAASLVRTTLVVAAISLFSGQVMAQETSSSLRGVVTDSAGNGLAATTVTIRSEGTSLTRSTQTNSNGGFSIRNLPVGSDYTVTVRKSGYGNQSQRSVALNLGQVTDLSFELSSASMDEVVVVASALAAPVAVGPNATFDLDDLESKPAINRTIADIVRTDPRIYVDESRGDINAVQCAGKNSRFNSLTVDGVRLNDSFGLNSNGYPTERMPFSYDSLKQVAVELSPFDAKYGGFTACNINAVTKSGTNTISGSAFMDFTNDGLRADSLEGQQIQTSDYDETRFGFNVGGPIIEDQLFFFVAYESLDGANLFDRGAQGSGAVNEIEVTQAELDEIVQIARDHYLYDPGPIPSSLDKEDEKLLIKLDWYVADNQRLAFTYNYNDGNNFTQSDGDNDEFEFQNHLYERGAELTSYVGTLYSDWTDNFSTQIRLGYLELNNRQVSLGGTDFGEIRVELADVDVYLGGDDSRQSNKLNYDVTNVAFVGNYYLDGHNLTFGFETEQLSIFNLFVQHTETEIRFDGIDDFHNGFADAIYYNNAPSNNPTDAAAVWGYDVNTLYLQDEFDISDRLTVVAGIRYDWYSTDDAPGENPIFVADYGFSNSTNVDGEGLFQPRVGFTFDYSDNISVRGGVGVYSGGNPNVWLSNNFSANNVLQFGQRGRSFGYTDGTRSLFDPDVVYAAVEASAPNGAGPGYGVPQELFDAVAGGTGDNFEINYLDPNFKIPSDVKYALGLTWYAPNEYVVNADVLLTKADNTAVVLHGDLEETGRTAEGYPQYDDVREPTFVLTNSPVGDESFGWSVYVSKAYDNGMDWTFGYAYTDSQDVSPMTSSVAFSNYQNRAFFDPQETVLSRSNYSIDHRVTATFNWEGTFWGDYPTRLTVYGHYNQGQPYSITFNGTINPYGFTPWLDFNDNVLRPSAERNSQDGSWWGKVDVRVSQQLPGFMEGHSASAFLVIDNFTNFLNEDWGVLRQADFPFTVAEGDTTPESRRGDASRYEIRMGVKYSF